MARTQEHTKSSKAKRPVNTFGGFEPSSTASADLDIGDLDTTAAESQATDATDAAAGGDASAADQQGAPGGKVSDVIQQLDLVKDGFATHIGEIAEKVRVLAPKDGGLGRAGDFVSGNLSTVQSFLGERSTAQVVTATLTVLRKNPIPVAFGAIGAAVGVLVSSKLEARRAASSTSATIKSRAKTSDGVAARSKSKDASGSKEALN